MPGRITASSLLERLYNFIVGNIFLVIICDWYVCLRIFQKIVPCDNVNISVFNIALQDREQIVFNVNLMIYLFLPIALSIAAVGVSGGAYVIRNMVWTEGIFVANDFWRGIKLNFKQILLIALLYSVVFYLMRIAISFADIKIAIGTDNAWLLVISKIFSITFLIFYTIMTFHMITMCVTYELKLHALIKNSFLFIW